MEYTHFILFLAGLGGIFTHVLMKIDSLNRKYDGEVNYGKFFRVEWASIAISIIVVLVAMIAREEIASLKAVGSYLALGYFAIGIAAQSLAYMVKGRTEKIIEKETPGQ